MYKFVISKLEQDAANTDHLATSIRSLNNKHKNKLYKRIANIINELRELLILRNKEKLQKLNQDFDSI